MTDGVNPLSWGGKPPVEAPCAVCGAVSPKSHVVTAATPLDRSGQLHFYACDACGSVFPHPFEQPDYGDDYGYPDYTRFYCELGAGIDFMIRPIEIASRYTPIRSFLDAGCGFGFTVDFAQRMLGAKSIGFDPSACLSSNALRQGVVVVNGGSGPSSCEVRRRIGGGSSDAAGWSVA